MLPAFLHPILPVGIKPRQEVATEAEEVKEKVCRLNQEVGRGWFLSSNFEEYHFGIRDMPHIRAFQGLEPVLNSNSHIGWMTLGKSHNHSEI